MDNAELKQELIDLLRERFGGLDFWRLSKKWKDVRYAQFADMLITVIIEEERRTARETVSAPQS